MIQRAIITVADETGRYEADLEIPITIPIRDAAQQLAAYLAKVAPQHFPEDQGIQLLANRSVLDENRTLASYGIWDGARLTIRRASLWQG